VNISGCTFGQPSWIPQTGGWISWMKEESLEAQHFSTKLSLEAMFNADSQYDLDGYQRWQNVEAFLDGER
jgi:hypothetical protein